MGRELQLQSQCKCGTPPIHVISYHFDDAANEDKRNGMVEDSRVDGFHSAHVGMRSVQHSKNKCKPGSKVAVASGREGTFDGGVYPGTCSPETDKHNAESQLKLNKDRGRVGRVSGRRRRVLLVSLQAMVHLAITALKRHFLAALSCKSHSKCCLFSLSPSAISTS